MKRPLRIRELLLLTASLGFALVLAEVGLRLVGFTGDQDVWSMPDERFGRVLRPGAEGWWRAEGETYVRINSDGLRDREHQLPKPPGTLRIAVLGDSFSEAKQVAMENTFWAVLERELAPCAGSWGKTHVEVINFGKAGYGTGLELLTLRENAWKYDPDIVLLQFFSGNDLANNRPATHRGCTDYFVYERGNIILRSHTRDCRQSAQTGSSFGALRLVQLIKMARKTLYDRVLRSKVLTKEGTLLEDPDQVEPGIWSKAFQPPKDATWQEAWQITEGLIKLMNEEVRAHNAEFWIMTATVGIQVYPERAIRDAFERRFGAGSLLYADRRIETLAMQEGIPMILLAPRFAAFADERNVFLHGFSNTALGTGHWNAEGHRLAGEIIAQEMCSERRGPP